MAIYRPPKARWPLALAVGAVCLVAGLIAGYLAGGHGSDDPLSAARSLEQSLKGAAVPLDVAALEYRQGVKNGVVVNQDGYSGASANLARARSRYRDVESAVAAFDPTRASELDGSFERAARLIAGKASPDEVSAALERTKELLGSG